MYSQESDATPTYITFHYLNGQSDSFNIHHLTEPGVTRQDIRQEIRRFLSEGWWVVKLPDETLFINASQVVKIEMKPPITSLEGEGVLSEAQWVTALNRPR
jgi:hypothetical protein